MDDELDILMSNDIITGHMSTRNIEFSRAQAGWLYKYDKSVRGVGWGRVGRGTGGDKGERWWLTCDSSVELPAKCIYQTHFLLQKHCM